MPRRSSKRPRDANQLAKFVIDMATDQSAITGAAENKNPAAVALGRLGGLKGGMARAAALLPEDRKRIAKLAAKARWGKRKRDKT